jgi:hypothetical protein
VREIEAVGLKAVSLSAESLSAASCEGRNLFEEICLCQWSVVLLSAERLASKELDAVVRNETFRKNLVVYGIDEAHVVVPWSVDFRLAYHQAAILPKRLPDHVALVVTTATLAPGHAYDSLVYSALSLKPGNFHCQRLSTERPNVRTVITELTHGLNSYKFPDISWVFTTESIKVVLYCRTLELGFRIAMYGWSLCGEDPLGCVRLWNSLTSPSYNEKTLQYFHDNPRTCVIVASIAFGMGMNVKNITHSINLGIPDSCDALVQQNGRAGRDLTSESWGWTYVEPSVMAAVRNSNSAERREDETREVCSDPETSHGSSARKTNAKPKSRQKKSTNKSAGGEKNNVAAGGRALDGNLLRLLQAHERGRCLEAEKNDIYGNPGELAKANCQQAQRPLPCSSCDPSWPGNHSSNLPTIMSVAPVQVEDIKTHSPGIPTIPLPPPLTKACRDHAMQKLLEFADERWALKEGPRFRVIPDTAFWPLHVLNRVLDQFHLLRSQDSLNALLPDWEFLQSDGNVLFQLLERLNKRYDGRVVKSKELKARKAAATRARNKGNYLVCCIRHDYSLTSSARKQRVNSAATKENLPPAPISIGTSHATKTTVPPLQPTPSPIHYPPALPPTFYPYTMPQSIPYLAPYVPQPIPYLAPYHFSHPGPSEAAVYITQPLAESSRKRYNAVPADQQGSNAKRSRLS